MRKYISLITNSMAVRTCMILAAIILFAACKGRNLDNVESNGETMEVVIPEESVMIDHNSSLENYQESQQQDTSLYYESSDSLQSAPLQFQNF